MAQYIDKDALVAEIIRRRKAIPKEEDDKRLKAVYGNEAFVLTELLEYIDTLKVEEVDFENETDKFYGIYRKNGRTYSTEDNEECLDWKVDCNPDFVISFAKHFFELGIAVSNKTQKGE